MIHSEIYEGYLSQYAGLLTQMEEAYNQKLNF